MIMFQVPLDTIDHQKSFSANQTSSTDVTTIAQMINL